MLRSADLRSARSRLNPVAGPYFVTAGIPITAGRAPTAAEEADLAPVVVVSEQLAGRLWPGESALGRQVRHSVPGARSPSIDLGQPWLTVVGVAGDVRADGPGRPYRGEIYTSWWRSPGAGVTLMVRSSTSAAALRDAVVRAEPAAGFRGTATLETALAYSLATERFASWLLAALAALALGLALLGVHGVVAHATRRRTREIGVRVALGASSRAIQRRVVCETLGLVAPGIVIGVVAAVGISWLADSFLHWVPPADIASVAFAVTLFLLAGLLASWLPARSTSALDPSEALRAE